MTADGEIRRVDAETEPDLFWAIRGGGGNFGVATRFRFRLHELDTVVGGMLMLPATVETIAGFMAESKASPEELGTIANVMKAPPLPFVPEEAHGKLVIMALMAYAGDTDAGQRALAPFRALAEPMADMLRPMPYPEVYPPEQEGYHPVAITSDDVRRPHRPRRGRDDPRAPRGLDRDVGAGRSAAGSSSDAGRSDGSVPVDATAFAHRTSPIMVNVVAIFERPDESEVHGPWVDGFAGASISATTERTSTSSATRVRSGSARRTRAPRGIACGRSRHASTRRTCSISTRTSRRPPHERSRAR